MIDIKKYLTDKDDIKFVQDICDAVAVDSQCEVFLKYVELPLLLEPHGEEIQVWSQGVMLGRFETIDDLLLNFKLNDKPFILCTVDMDYD